jgi:hypothetical protein
MRNMLDMQESCGGAVVSGVEKPLYICERCQGELRPLTNVNSWLKDPLDRETFRHSAWIPVRAQSETISSERMRECHESGQLLTPLPKRAARAVRNEEKRRGFIIQGKARCQGGEEGGLER